MICSLLQHSSVDQPPNIPTYACSPVTTVSKIPLCETARATLVCVRLPYSGGDDLIAAPCSFE